MKMKHIITIFVLAIVGVITYEGSCVNLPANSSNISAFKINEMQTKKCSSCKTVKVISEFSPHKGFSHGVFCYCKSCNNIKNKKYAHTKKGLITRIYAGQLRTSRERGHGMPEYNLIELREWCLSQDVFHVLFDDWVSSGYKRGLSPSCDRMDDYKGYSLDRLKLMTWGKNLDKGNSDRKNGINNKVNKSVIATHRNTRESIEFYSIMEASRRLGVACGNIGNCLNGNIKSVGNFTWEYADKT